MPVQRGGATSPINTAWPPRVVRGNWTRYEDRPGKGGWISHGPSNSTLEFNVSFGRSPRLTLVYEVSYVGFGTATASIGGGAGAQLDGMRYDGLNVTQTEVLVLNVHQEPFLWVSAFRKVPAWHIRPWTSHTLRVTLTSAEGLKFKLILVSSC